MPNASPYTGANTGSYNMHALLRLRVPGPTTAARVRLPGLLPCLSLNGPFASAGRTKPIFHYRLR